MTKDLKERIAEGWAMLDPVDPLRGLLSDVIDVLAQPAQEPVAYFDWMPKGATHITQIKVRAKSGGCLDMGAYVFKYDNEVLMVYTTDNDNEYPGWREAKECFYHLNFPISPIPTTPQLRPWVGLTEKEVQDAHSYAAKNCPSHDSVQCFADAIQAKLKEKNT